MNKRMTAGLALAVGATLALAPALAAQAASGIIVNGNFEADEVGAESITGWTSLNQAVDLGVTSIAGCVTTDTSNYSNLRDYATEAEGLLDRYAADVPDHEDWYYVHDQHGDPVFIFGDPLVWDDWDEYYYLEVDAEPTSAPASLSSASVEGEAGGEAGGEAPTEESPVDETPAEDAPAEESPSGDAPTEDAPSSEAPEEDSPAEEAPVDEAPADEAPADEPADDSSTDDRNLSPAIALVSYLHEDNWSSDQWDAFDAVRAANVPDPVERGDDIANAGLSEEEYRSSIVDGVDVGREGKVLELYSDLDGDLDGYVIHGPAIFSEPFSVPAGRQISLDWKAVDESDDFHVFGYLLNTSTCTQTEVIDATGEMADWSTVAVSIPSAGTYRFVFVAGSYDYSWGGAAGAYLYIDNIIQSVAFDGAGVDVGLAAGVGDYLPGSDVQISGGGLTPASAYDLVLRSTPVTVAEGVTDDEGRFVDIVALPDSIEPGAHTITLTGEGPDGPVSQVVYITVGSDGTLLYLSTDGPQPALAMTGPAESSTLAVFAVLLTLAGAAAMEWERRRRDPLRAFSL